MISIKKAYECSNLKENEIILDIETTGLDSNYDKLVLLGLILIENKKSYLEQYFAVDDDEEKRLLNILLEKIENKKIINYNGDIFDIPFLNNRLIHHKINSSIYNESFDIYKYLKSKRYFFQFDSMKLVNIEKMVNIFRNDPSRYKSISRLNDDIVQRENPEPILIHNQNDLIATEKLSNIEEIINSKLSITYDNNIVTLLDVSINNNIAKIKLNSKNELKDSFFTSSYQIETKKNEIILFINVLYGKISPNVSGYVTKNIFFQNNLSKYIISKDLLTIKEGKQYNYKNILNFTINIIKENLIS